MRRILFSLAFFAATTAFADPAQVLLLRHGEKSEDGNQLSDAGWDRAKALPKLFDHPGFRDLGKPAAIYAQKPTHDQPSIRAKETVKFLADDTGVKVNLDFERDDYKAMVKEILKKDSYDGKLVVICWEHNRLEDIAAAFGVDPKPKYPNDRFDRAWLLTLKGDDVKFEDLPEKLLPGDKRN